MRCWNITYSYTKRNYGQRLGSVHWTGWDDDTRSLLAMCCHCKVSNVLEALDPSQVHIYIFHVLFKKRISLIYFFYFLRSNVVVSLALWSRTIHLSVDMGMRKSCMLRMRFLYSLHKDLSLLNSLVSLLVLTWALCSKSFVMF